MYNVSVEFKQAIKQPSRIISAKVEINGNVYDEEYIIGMNYEDTSNPSSQFEIGTTSATMVELSLMNVNEVFETSAIRPYIGLEIDGSVEYVPLGVFYADDVKRKKNVVNLTLYDAMIKLEQAYFSDLTYPATITDVINEVATKTGITFEGVLPNYQINKKPEGYTYREIVGLIASMCGGFAKFNRDGKLTIKSYVNVSESITSDNYIDYNKKKDTVYRIDKITVQTDETILTAGNLSAGGSEVSFENPWMTQAILNDIFAKLNGFEYLPTYVKIQGNPALECGDIVTLTTADNEIINIPIMKHKLSYSGGLIGEIESEGESENQNTFNSSGSMSRKVERVVYEQALINEALINKANIADLVAETARIDNLYTSVAEIDTLLAGNITAENMAVGAIYAGSGVIAQGAIGDAEISNLSANKLLSGTIDTSVVAIAGPNGRMRLIGNKLQIFDLDSTANLYERIMLGIDEGNNAVLVLRGADGQTVLLNQDGLTNAGFTDGYNKLADDSLDPVKIDISQVVTRINNGTQYIVGSKIRIDNETLDSKFYSFESTLNSHGETLVNHSSQIQQNAESISQKVSTQTYQTDLNGINSRLSTAESTINQHSNEINLRVKTSDYTGNTIASLINQTATTITIQASRINFNGHVFGQNATFSGNLVQNGSWGTINIQDGSTYITGTKYTGSGLYDNYSVDTRYSGIGIDGSVFNGVYNRRFILNAYRLLMDSTGGGEFGGFEILNNYFGGNIQFTGLRNSTFEFRLSNGDEYTGSSRLFSITPDGIDTIGKIVLGSGTRSTLTSLSDGSLRHSNSYGYINIGPKNSSYAHIYTDRPSFYFNKGATFLGDVSITGGYVKVNAIDHNGVGSHLYIRPMADGEGRCTAIGTTTTYRPFRASSFPTSSAVEYKQDIHVWEESALELIRHSTIYEYRLKDEVANGIDRLRQGLVIGEGYNTPAGVVDGDGVEQYLMNAWSWKAIQELDIEQRTMKDRIVWLENKIIELEALVA